MKKIIFLFLITLSCSTSNNNNEGHANHAISDKNQNSLKIKKIPNCNIIHLGFDFYFSYLMLSVILLIIDL